MMCPCGQGAGTVLWQCGHFAGKEGLFFSILWARLMAFLIVKFLLENRNDLDKRVEGISSIF